VPSLASAEIYGRQGTVTEVIIPGHVVRRAGTKVIPQFYSENIIAIAVKFTSITHTSFAIIR
jgi:hypothetical protein